MSNAESASMRESPEAGVSQLQRRSPVHAWGRALLTVRGLRKAFGGQVVLDGVDLELHAGEVVLLRGENGSGKTTLLNILTGNLRPDAGMIEYAAGDRLRTYRFPRSWWQELVPWDRFQPEFVAAEGIGRTWQDVRLFRAQSLLDNIAVALPGQPGERLGWALFATGRVRRGERQTQERARALLVRLGLEGRGASSADRISLGQSKRVAIARAVAAGARVLFLDEPLAGLDRPGIAKVVNLLEQIVSNEGVTLVVIEHVYNHAHLHDLVTTDWLLHNGTIASASRQALGPTPNAKTKPWLRLLVEAGSTVTEERLPHGATLTRIRRAHSEGALRQPVLEVRDLVVRRGARVVIGTNDQGQETGLNLALFDGEIAVLQAPNGWGKSTLFSAIAGLVAPARGKIVLDGEDLGNLPTWVRARRGARLVTADNNSFPYLSAKDVLRLAGKPESATLLGASAERLSSELSGGQKQHLALLSQCNQPSTKPRMFDEPFANLDAAAIEEAAHNIVSQGTGAVLVALPSITN